MFRIRKIADDASAANAAAIRDAAAILRAQFPGAPQGEFEQIARKIRDPLKARFRTLLFVAEDAEDHVRGAALVLHAPDLDFVILDYVAVRPGRGGGGIGGALYQRVREEALRLGAAGVFFECLPDDPALCRDPKVLKQNVDRLRFYERFGARPIAGTRYETPVKPGDDCPPYLVFDDCGTGRPLPAADARRIVRAFLERKYAKLCPPDYVEMIVASFRDDPVRLRPFKYVRARSIQPAAAAAADPIRLVVSDRHEIHHVRERGYVQAPVRISAIMRELESAAPFERVAPRAFPDSHIRAVHEPSYVDYLRRACAQVPKGKSVYPYVFPIRNTKRPPKELPLRAGYFCMDTFTPLNLDAWTAARRAVDCALTAAQSVLAGAQLAYALVRPPGHHAERRAFGGFCYFNNAAIAANFLVRYGKIAVLDIDYHHGNGTQDIFWTRSDVLTVSIHGHPSFAYPYFSGFREEAGEGPGKGFNVNFPLPERLPADAYVRVLEGALKRIERHRPAYLVLALGYDTGAGDPTGSWSNRPKDFERIGHMIGAFGRPTVIVQEGGYRTRTLPQNARAFFRGLWKGRVEVLAQGNSRAHAKDRAAP